MKSSAQPCFSVKNTMMIMMSVIVIIIGIITLLVILQKPGHYCCCGIFTVNIAYFYQCAKDKRNALQMAFQGLCISSHTLPSSI